MRLGKSVLLVVLAAAAGSAQAAGAGLRIGTTGIGGDLGWEIAPTLGGRVGLSAGSYSTDVKTDDVNYDAKLKLGNLNAFLDWSPLGPFRISAGVIANNNKVDVNGQASANPAITVSGTVKPSNSVAPYLGIGYGNVWTKGVNFYFDLGVMFQGSPKASLTANCGAATGTPTCTQAQNQAAAEEQKLEDKLKNYKYFPVANIGITIGF
jgi:hypothetical protein